MKALRRHLLQIADGSPDVFWELAQRAVRGTGRQRTERAGAVLLVGSIGFAMLDAWPWLAGVAITIWCWKAHRAADREELIEEQQAEAREQITRTLDEVLLRVLLDHIGNESGIHLADLLPLIQDSDERLEHLTREDLRDLLAVLGVAIRPQLRVGARTGIAGVHRDDARQALADYLARATPPTSRTDT